MNQDQGYIQNIVLTYTLYKKKKEKRKGKKLEFNPKTYLTCTHAQKL